MSSIKTQYPSVIGPMTWLFLLLWLVWWLEFGLRVEFFAKIRLEFLLAMVVGVGALMGKKSKPQPGLRKKGVNGDLIGCMVAYLVVMLFSLPFAADFEVAWTTFINAALKYAILGFLIAHYVVSPKTLGLYLLTVLVAFLKIGQEAFLGNITGSQVWENQGVQRLHGTQGTMFGHPNSLSGRTISMLSFIWYLFPAVKNRWVRIMMLMQLVFAINIIIFTASRTGYLTCFVMFVGIFALTKKKGRLILVFMALFATAAILVPDQYVERFKSAFTGEEKEGRSADTRMGLLKDSLRVFGENPLGVGGYCFPIVQERAGRNAQETHNLYTQVLVETGFQGFICFLALLFVTMRKAVKTRRGFMRLINAMQASLGSRTAEERAVIQKEIETNQFIMAAASGVIVFLIIRMSLGVFGHDLYEIYWWAAAGLAMALANLLETARKRAVELGFRVT